MLKIFDFRTVHLSMVSSLLLATISFSQQSENVSAVFGSNDLVYTVGSISGPEVSSLLSYSLLEEDPITLGESTAVPSHYQNGFIRFEDKVNVEVYNLSGQRLYQSNEPIEFFDTRLLGNKPSTYILILKNHQGETTRQKWISKSAGLN